MVLHCLNKNLFKCQTIYIQHKIEDYLNFKSKYETKQDLDKFYVI